MVLELTVVVCGGIKKASVYIVLLKVGGGRSSSGLRWVD
jgi:hypothetical protein